MQAIILAAGMGRRLKDLTKENTKCMVKVNDKTLIQRMLGQIDAKGFSRVVIVVGYEGEKLKEYISSLDVSTPIVFVENPVYDKTNNIYSLYLARDYLQEEDTVLFESDLIFEDSVLDSLLDDPNKNLVLVDKYESWMSGTCVKLSEESEILSYISGTNFDFHEIDKYYKTVNIYKFNKDFSSKYYVPFLEAYLDALGNNEYYEQVLKVITMLDGKSLKAKKLDNQKWYEIDDIQDLNIAESIFAEEPHERVNLINSRYGGYWRYPKLLDFCYLVNPYYPPKMLREELRASFDTLLTEYPSGMYVNSLLAGNIFSVKEENIVVGNGAAELIKSLMERLKGKVGFIRPTFEEYPNRYDASNSVNYFPENPDYSYTAQDIMEFFNGQDVDSLLIVNPDNPSGNYIPKPDLLKLIAWSKEKNIKIIIDESFVDFADEEDSSLIDQELLDENKHLYVMKSISKSYGVPGLRLGILASGDKDMIQWMKKDVSIWNINSFAEFFMQIEEKYKGDYEAGLVKLREERKRFETELNKLDDFRVIPSQANYVMVEVEKGSSEELQKELLVNYDILIKDLSPKLGGCSNYIRLAIRKREENDLLLNALKKLSSR
ncbi:MAG: aminotransferase class I/II-fold pyridoxal phosphate-dependent enzyme [Firmicutes bacterium]|nr:aminotransferase class I/II-fold pyridoxal phosphate-dependent enzyme [Bacillota bacterium]